MVNQTEAWRRARQARQARRRIAIARAIAAGAILTAFWFVLPLVAVFSDDRAWRAMAMVFILISVRELLRPLSRWR